MPGWTRVVDLGSEAAYSGKEASRDAFARFRVSNPETIFDSKQLGDNSPLVWDDAETSGGGTSSTYQVNRSSSLLAVSDTTAGLRVRQTKRWFNYQPGKSQNILMTFIFGAPTAGIRRRAGLFQANNGIFLQQDGSGAAFVVRSFVTGAVDENVVPQAQWNLDKMDGAGPSGVKLDLTKSQILFFDFEWLGVGGVRIGFVVGNRVVYAHIFDHANILPVVYMTNPNLPLRYELENDGTGPAATLETVCATVVSEGGRSLLGPQLSLDRESTGFLTANNASLFPLIAIRLKAAYLHATVLPQQMSLLCTTSSAFLYRLLLNPTVVGPAFVFTPYANSAVEYDLTRTNTTTVTGGTNLLSGYSNQQASGGGGGGDLAIPPDNPLGSFIDGTSDVLVLAVARLSTQAETFYGSLTWREAR